MASSILRRTLATAATPSSVKIGLIPADGIGREGKMMMMMMMDLLWYMNTEPLLYSHSCMSIITINDSLTTNMN